MSQPPQSPSPIYLDYDVDRLHEQYNNRAKVPGFQNIVQDWTARSAEALNQAAHVTCDLPYGSKPRQRLDLFLPDPAHPSRATASAANALPPLHVFVHGGYWQAMDKDVFSFLAPAFTNANIAFANLEYTLCPQTDMFGIIEEIKQALIHLYDNAAKLGFDRRRIVLSGHSAGGQLAALMAATPWPDLDRRLPQTLLAGVLPISGIFDLEPLRHIPIGDPLRLQAQQIKTLSPLYAAYKSRSPMVIALGALEGREYHRQAEEFAQHLAKHNITAPIYSVAARNHFTILEELASSDGALFQAVKALLKMSG